MLMISKRVVVVLASILIEAQVVNALATNSATATCATIAKKISSASAVYYPGSSQYASDNAHPTNSSSQASACSVEPGTAADVAIILTTLGQTGAPFGVKGGGHAYHQKFSSTTGVQVAMSRFNTVTYNATSQVATVGSGLVWDQVYAALEPYGVTAVGARVRNIGVAGFALGGGYSWHTNQYGLSIDTITAIELVTPQGEIRTVTALSDPDLFFALKGGYNNFGIVTSFTFRTFPQGQVWGGLSAYVGALYADTLTAATAKFATTVTDPKAELLFNYGYQDGAFIISVLLFYDGPTPPPGIFDDFITTPAVFQDFSTRSFSQLIGSFPDVLSARGVHGALPVIRYTTEILTALRNQTEYWGAQLAQIDPSIRVSFSAEPFLPTILTHGNASAYPPRRDIAFQPTSLDFAWTSPAADTAANAAATAATLTLTAQVVEAGQNILGATPYGNYAYNATPDALIFGASLPRLRAVKALVDPKDVMDQTGGWKV